ncbi:MAG: glycoside hydrolase family 5 protein [Clostridia bacterium]|nr:glycoside hydrolase family 5 protein [Clostridia bacterium]
MKKCIALMIAFIMMWMQGASLSEEKSEMSMLRAQGTDIVNQNGEIVLLRGVNAGGWLIMESWMTLTNAPSQLEAFKVLDERFGKEKREELFKIYEDNYFSDSDFDNIKALGMNVVRLPFAWWNLMDDAGKLKENAFFRLDWFVEKCAERGIYVILDLHAAPGSQNGNDHSGDITGAKLFDSEEYMAKTELIWTEVAKHFKGNPAVAAYDLLNEPGGKLNSTGVVQWEMFNRLYKAIRTVDKDHIIMMESCWDPSDLPAPDKYGWENVVYQYHFYKWNADNDYQAQKLFVDVKMHNLKKTNHPVPSFVGEFTLFQSMDAWKYALKTYSDAGIGWTIWTYKVTGNSTWGLYNVHGTKADIYNDTYEEIETKWREQGTLKRNTALCQVVADAIYGENVTLPEEPSEKTDTPVVHLPVETVKATMGASVKEEDGVYRLTTKASLDPSYIMNAISYTLQESVDAMPYKYITFYIKDLQGSNTHKVTLMDADGKFVSLWVDIPSVYNEWTRINCPLSMFNGIDLGRLLEVRIGEWNSGDYLFDKLFLCNGTMDE